MVCGAPAGIYTQCILSVYGWRVFQNLNCVIDTDCSAPLLSVFPGRLQFLLTFVCGLCLQYILFCIYYLLFYIYYLFYFLLFSRFILFSFLTQDTLFRVLFSLLQWVSFISISWWITTFLNFFNSDLPFLSNHPVWLFNDTSQLLTVSCVWMFCLYACTMCCLVPMEVRRGHQIPGAGFTDGCGNQACVCCKSNKCSWPRSHR